MGREQKVPIDVRCEKCGEHVMTVQMWDTEDDGVLFMDHLEGTCPVER